MSQQTITIAFVNQPRQAGGKKGSVKDTEGRYWGVWADKLGQYQVGQSYDITFETTQWQGKDQHTIKSATARGAPVAANNGNGMTPRQPTAPTDAERMFVCSLLNAGIQSGKIDVSENSVGAATNMLRRVWQGTFGAQ